VLRKSAKSVPEIAALYNTHGSPQLTVGVGLDRKIAKEREQLIAQPSGVGGARIDDYLCAECWDEISSGLKS